MSKVTMSIGDILKDLKNKVDITAEDAQNFAIPAAACFTAFTGFGFAASTAVQDNYSSLAALAVGSVGAGAVSSVFNGAISYGDAQFSGGDVIKKGAVTGFAGGVVAGGMLLFNALAVDVDAVDVNPAAVSAAPTTIQLHGDCGSARFDNQKLIIPAGCAIAAPSQG